MYRSLKTQGNKEEMDKENVVHLLKVIFKIKEIIKIMISF